LAQVLRHLSTTRHADLLVGPEHGSDAGVFRLRDDLAIVQTTDFFPPLVDDPFTFGQIAAANSLSDCYAMGARPVTCLNIVGFPDQELPIEVLDEILAGGSDKVAEAGAVIVGGHSLRDSEVKYGLAVTGVVHPAEFFTNRGARPGDRLILTKPLGTGILTSAAKAGKIGEAELRGAIEVMVQLNGPAARVAREVGAHAVTDITGFGLIGHAYEMAEGSGVSLEIDAASAPLIGSTLRLAGEGTVTRAWESTLEHVGDRLKADGVDATLVKVLADAQTSGGLLMAVAASRIREALEKLGEAGVVAAAEIGRVVEREPGTIILR
jgi:selenide,water dikinase